MLLSCGVGEDSWESLGLKGDQTSRSKRKSVLKILWPPDAKNHLIRKDPDAGKDWRQEEGMTEDEMVGWHHWLNGHEFEQVPGDGVRQGSVACCSPWGHKESDTTERKNWTDWHIVNTPQLSCRWWQPRLGYTEMESEKNKYLIITEVL